MPNERLSVWKLPAHAPLVDLRFYDLARGFVRYQQRPAQTQRWFGERLKRYCYFLNETCFFFFYKSLGRKITRAADLCFIAYRRKYDNRDFNFKFYLLSLVYPVPDSNGEIVVRAVPSIRTGTMSVLEREIYLKKQKQKTKKRLQRTCAVRTSCCSGGFVKKRERSCSCVFLPLAPPLACVQCHLCIFLPR